MKIHFYFLLLHFLCIQSLEEKCYYDPTITRNFFNEEYELPLRIEVSNRISHQLVSEIVKILLKEVIGYPNVELIKQDKEAANATNTLQKISNCIDPSNCSEVNESGPPVMINLEVWITPGFNLEQWIQTDRVLSCGPLGPVGRSGWYILDLSVNFLWMSGIVIDHWKAFTDKEVVKNLNLTTDNIPVDKELCTFEDCEDGVYRPILCRQENITCATLLAEYPASSFDILKEQITKLKLYVQVAWLGDRLNELVESRTKVAKSTLIFHRKPMFLNTIRNFIHISFPNCEDNSEVPCNFELNQLEKIVWSKIKTEARHAFHLIQQINFEHSIYSHLQKRYINLINRGMKLNQIACEWVRENSYIWQGWISKDNQLRDTLFIGGIFPLTGTHWRQSGVKAAAELAAAAINKNTSILPNHEIKILSLDGQCVADEVLKSYIHYLTQPTFKNMAGILGPACTDTVESIAGIAKSYHTIILSYSAEGAIFDREDSEYFFRTIPENNIFPYVYLEVLKELKFKTVSALSEENQKYSKYVFSLPETLRNAGISVISEKFPQNQKDRKMKIRAILNDIKNNGSLVIIGEFYENIARIVMCEAYNLGMTAYNKFVWFLPLWYTSDWYDVDSMQNRREVNCSTEEIFTAINGHLSLSYKFYAEDDFIMQEGKRVGTWMKEYENDSEKKKMNVSRYGGYAYDAVWMYADALDKLFKENISNSATLHSIKTSKRIKELLGQTEMNGVSGSLSFLKSSRLTDIYVWQWHNKSEKIVGVYHPSSKEEGILDLNETNIIWLTDDGKKPKEPKKEEKDTSNCSLEGLKRLLGVECETAMIIVNVVGIGIFVLFLIFAILVFKHRYEKQIRDTERRIKELGLTKGCGPFALDDWEMPRDQIVINRKLGEGAFGTVYGGEANLKNKGWISVAVKTLKNGAKSDEKLEFLSEAQVMKQFDHINIVKLIGVCTMGEPVYTIMEFMLYGDLKTYLLSRRSIAAERDRMNNDEVSNRRLTNMALDIARGLSYLADKKYVHRDLACRNCLVNISRSVKIGDYGMCRPMYDSEYYRYNKKGLMPVRWMAPESLIDGIFTPMSDAWSYGIVLYEIITFASVPYQGLSNSQVLEYIKSHKTLSVPKGSKSELNLLLMKCWSLYPQDRPKACEIVEILANSPELISPCLEMPVTSVETLDSGTLELGHDRARGHSFSSVWQARKPTNPNDLGQSCQTNFSQTAQHDNAGLKHSAVKFSKRSLHESIKRKNKKESRKEKNDVINTYL